MSKVNEVAVLQAEIREGSGKGVARALRRDNKIPAIIYGGNKEEIKMATPLKEFFLEFRRGGFKSKLLELDFGKEKIRVVPRDVQVHPVTEAPIHADFLRVENDTKVHVFIKVKFLNSEQSPGLKRGGVLNIIRREVELICRADSIPALLEIDLTGVKIGDSLHAHSIHFPDGVEPAIKDRDFTIAAIVGRSMKTEEEEDAEAAAAAEAAEEAAAAEAAAEGEEAAE